MILLYCIALFCKLPGLCCSMPSRLQEVLTVRQQDREGLVGVRQVLPAWCCGDSWGCRRPLSQGLDLEGGGSTRNTSAGSSSSAENHRGWGNSCFVAVVHTLSAGPLQKTGVTWPVQASSQGLWRPRCPVLPYWKCARAVSVCTLSSFKSSFENCFHKMPNWCVLVCACLCTCYSMLLLSVSLSLSPPPLSLSLSPSLSDN